VGDQYVTLAAANLVSVMRAWPPEVRQVYAEFYSRTREGGTADFYAALDVLLGEIQAEEVRAVNAAMDGINVNRVRAEWLMGVDDPDDDL